MSTKPYLGNDQVERFTREWSRWDAKRPSLLWRLFNRTPSEAMNREAAMEIQRLQGRIVDEKAKLLRVFGEASEELALRKE